MRLFIIILLSLFCQSAFAADSHRQDSLLSVLNQSKSSQQRIKTLRDLADLCYESPSENLYLKQLITEAEKTNDHSSLLNALGDLSNYFLGKGDIDSARHYLNEIKQADNTTASTCLQTFLRMCLFEAEMKKGSKNSVEAINIELDKLTSEVQKKKTIYEKIEDAYIIACGYKLQDKYQQALPFCISAFEQAKELPFKEGMQIRMQIVRMLKLLYINNQQFEEVTPLVEDFIQLQENHYQQFLKNERPFYPIESFRIANYTTLIINIRHLPPEKTDFYLQSIIRLSNMTERANDKYNYFLAINNYHLFKRDYSKALITNDSLIKYAKALSPHNLPMLHEVNSRIYEVMGQPQKALEALRTSHALKDSLTTAESMEQLNKLQMRYDLNNANYEKSQLEIKNKQIMLISLSIVLLCSFLTSIYLYKIFKKEKAIKLQFRFLKTKAEESEKMKTVFINSMCHEIRTPLNAVVGFSSLIFDETIDQELRQDFPEEIQRNTLLLTGLINSMLEVANLDVSEEKLPCDITDLNAIFQNEMERIRMNCKPEINFHLNIPEDTVLISTNEQYLALVIENLLSNANKFTQEGDVTLEFQMDKAASNLRIAVTDTGCGIPADKQEEVFERFSKLNSFIPGNGLGLYLCRLIVTRLSGKIAIDPEYNTGTRVVINLPVQQY